MTKLNMKLEERLLTIKKENEKLYEEYVQSESERKKEERNKQTYKKLYVKIDEDAFLHWSIDNFIPFFSKEEFIEYACTLSDDKVNDYIYTISLYKELIDDEKKLDTYHKLYYELDNESIDKLKDYTLLNFEKGLLILSCINKYGEDKIRSIVYD